MVGFVKYFPRDKVIPDEIEVEVKTTLTLVHLRFYTAYTTLRLKPPTTLLPITNYIHLGRCVYLKVGELQSTYDGDDDDDDGRGVVLGDLWGRVVMAFHPRQLELYKSTTLAGKA